LPPVRGQEAPQAYRETPPDPVRSEPDPPPVARPLAGPPAATSSQSPPVTGGPRTVRLAMASVDPWSVLKLSFLLSVAIGIALVVASVVLWSVLDGMGVFTDINKVLEDVGGAQSRLNVYDYVGFGRVVSLSTVLGVVNVVLMTALSTLGAFLYNLASSLVGGLNLTLTDE
jgi:hypothetical protein